MHAPSLRTRIVAGVAVAIFASVAGVAAAAASSKPQHTTFSLFPQAAQLKCLKPSPDAPDPTVTVHVTRNDFNDLANIQLNGFKPNLDFDLFTIQHSPQTATGTPDVNKSVGMAWYQSDIHTGPNGHGTATIRTILLDQIFGVDADVALPPTNTFHMGFWFNNPSDASGCGFTGVTPFNGEHTAGPLAFVTRPDATTNLGPLCTDPISAGSDSFTCNP